MHSTLFHLGPLPIHGYGVMMALGFLAGLWNWTILGRREGRTFNDCSDLLFWIMVSGIAGGRLAYVAANWSEFAVQPIGILRLDQGGLIFYGGLLASGMALVVYARRRHESLAALVDFVITSLPLAHAFGRLGCFLHGCCHGRPWGGPLAVTFPAGSLPWQEQVSAAAIDGSAARSLAVHPVQLYEAAFNLALYAVLVAVYRRRRRSGEVTVVYLLVYPAGRFLLEYFRGTERLQWFGLSAAQAVSVALFALGLALAARLRIARPPAARPT